MAITSIADIRGRQVLDSRGNPTVEAEIFLDGGASARCFRYEPDARLVARYAKSSA